MPPVLVPSSTTLSEDVVVIETIPDHAGIGHAEEFQPPRLPKQHIEDLGPVSDMFPESWEYHPDLIAAFTGNGLFKS